jgi:hypothetical protein
MRWLLAHATGLNLGVSIAQFFLGIVIGFWVKPDLVRKGKSGEWTFGLWTSQWFIFSVTYLVIWRYPTHEALLLFLLDVQSLLILAAASTMLLGESFRIARTLITLGILMCVFGFYNFALDPWGVTSKPYSGDLVKWTLPSQTLSILSLTWIGFVACLRYRRYALPFALVAVAYGACQQALYSATVLRYQDISQNLPEIAPWYFAVAIGKALLGALFYGLTFMVLPTFSNLLPEYEPRLREGALKPIGKVLGCILSLFIVPFVFAILAAVFLSFFGK